VFPDPPIITYTEFLQCAEADEVQQTRVVSLRTPNSIGCIGMT
jgi:hypothetical protein